MWNVMHFLSAYILRLQTWYKCKKKKHYPGDVLTVPSHVNELPLHCTLLIELSHSVIFLPPCKYSNITKLASEALLQSLIARKNESGSDNRELFVRWKSERDYRGIRSHAAWFLDGDYWISCRHQCVAHPLISLGGETLSVWLTVSPIIQILDIPFSRRVDLQNVTVVHTASSLDSACVWF